MKKKPKTKLKRYILLEIGLGLCLFAVLTIPIMDYAKREALAYVREPTQKNLEVLQAKQAEESRLRLRVAVPFGLLMVLFAFPLYSEYSKARPAQQQ